MRKIGYIMDNSSLFSFSFLNAAKMEGVSNEIYCKNHEHTLLSGPKVKHRAVMFQMPTSTAGRSHYRGSTSQQTKSEA